jgi:hypothetical protein
VRWRPSRPRNLPPAAPAPERAGAPDGGAESPTKAAVRALVWAISGAIKQGESRSLAVTLGQDAQAGNAVAYTPSATFPAGHASSILVTRSTSSFLVRALYV